MATVAPSPGVAGHLSQDGLNAINWAGVGLAATFVVARTMIRYFKIERVGYDDYWILFAFVILTANAVLQHFQTPHTYYLAYVQAGLEPPGPLMISHGNAYVRYEFASIGLFWTTLWAVKASFLALFWKLFEGLQIFQRWWYAVVVFTFLAYVGCWIASINNCHPASAYFRFGECMKPIDVKGATIAVSYSTTVDVVTDLIIMALPLNLLWNIRITKRQRFGLVVVFCVGIIIIVVAIVRAVFITTKVFKDGVLLTIWSIIESTVSVCVGCLPPFKSLCTSRSRYPSPSSFPPSNGSSSHASSSRPGLSKFRYWSWKISTPTARSIRNPSSSNVRSPVGDISSPIIGSGTGHGSMVMQSHRHPSKHHSRSSTRVRGGASRQSDEEMVIPPIGTAHGGESQAPSTIQSPTATFFDNSSRGSGRMDESKDIMVQRDFVSASAKNEIDEICELYERPSRSISSHQYKSGDE